MLAVRMGGIVVMSVVSACGAERGAQPVPVDRLPAAGDVGFAPPSLAPTWAQPERRRVCVEGGDLDDFGYGYQPSEPLVIYGLAQGPRIAERPPEATVRTAFEVYRAMAHASPSFSGCYAWARQLDHLGAARQRVQFTIDPFGRVLDVSVAGAGEHLDGCAADALRAMRLGFFTPRLTSVSITVAFAPSDLSPPGAHGEALPPRPEPTPPATVTACAPQPATVPTDVLDVGDDVFITFDDWDEARWEADHVRKHGTHPPHLHSACTRVTGRVWQGAVLDAVRWNRGALQACYAEALRSDPDLAASVRVHALFRPMPAAHDGVQIHGPVSPELSACLAAAIEDVSLPHVPSDGSITLDVALALTPAPELPAEPMARGRVQIALGDAEGALQSFAEVIRTRGGDASCRARVGIVEAVLARAPWVDDPRVWRAVDELLAYADDVAADPALASCLGVAGELIGPLVTFPFAPDPDNGGVRPIQGLGRYGSSYPGDAVRRATVERTTRILEAYPHLPGRAFALELQAAHAARPQREAWSAELGAEHLNPSSPALCNLAP